MKKLVYLVVVLGALLTANQVKAELYNLNNTNISSLADDDKKEGKNCEKKCEKKCSTDDKKCKKKCKKECKKEEKKGCCKKSTTEGGTESKPE